MTEQAQEVQTEQEVQQSSEASASDFWSGFDPDIKRALTEMDQKDAAQFLAELKEKKSSANGEAKQYRLAKEKLEREMADLKAKAEKEKKEALRKEMSRIEALEDQLKEFQALHNENQSKLSDVLTKKQEADLKLSLVLGGAKSDPDSIDTLTTMLQVARSREGDEFDQEQWLESSKDKYPMFFQNGQKPVTRVPADSGLPLDKGQVTPQGEKEKVSFNFIPGDKKEQDEYREQRKKYGLSRHSLGY